MIPWLDPDSSFPPIESALAEPDGPNGLLAAGGDLSPERILEAYRQGIFPWFSPGDPILWWSPDPRMVLFPAEFRLSRSLRKRLKRGEFEVRIDTAFAQVMRACAGTPRPGQDGTWITREMLAAYTRLHELGFAHSVETWTTGAEPEPPQASRRAAPREDCAPSGGRGWDFEAHCAAPAERAGCAESALREQCERGGPRLVGGLYGMAIGRMFYGESMFSHATDASKVALAHLVRLLELRGCEMIDCQMNTGHLASLGAREIPRAEFAQRIRELTAEPPLVWPAGPIACEW